MIPVAMDLSRLLRGKQLMVLPGVLALGVMHKMVASIMTPRSMPILEVASRNLAQPIQHVVACLLLVSRRCFMG